ncbi:hypothetical protein BDV27DRAFT_167920 [Aspergillus caelatus]|uniref:Uncharacterized protein n=1 Tax=Aspergillus caelatus TaxID=61420 RepID=A0A5N6ZVL5_9EURO|nr:uncharacterized protein BDV27DRAFT_167920 [Aspergillus caelatus]KAE8360310.1 hypothetical protein BDV27DRAFT_167920 [Aspergillus caelatus]
MIEQRPPQSPPPQAQCSSRMTEMGTWTANISSRSDTNNKHHVPSSPPSHLEPIHSYGDVHYNTASRPQSPVWNRNERQISLSSDQSVALDADPTEGPVSCEANIQLDGPEAESAPCAEKITLKALLEKIRQEKGTEQVDLLSVCFGEPGVDLNVHIQGDFTVTLL